MPSGAAAVSSPRQARRLTGKGLASTLGERAAPVLFLSADVPFDLNVLLSPPVPCLLTVLIDYHVVVVPSLSPVRLCDPMDCSVLGFTVLHYLPKFAQTHDH